MMHSNGFIIALKNANKEVLRETNNGTVYLPFGSEYSILLKNNNNRKAQVTIKIDGTNVLGNHFIILHPNESTDLERFLIDGNLNSGNKFKFVSKNDNRVADPSNVDNGNIEVTFKLEKEDWKLAYSNNFPTVNWKFKETKTRGFTEYSQDYSVPVTRSATMYRFMAATVPSQEGATIEGSGSNQTFVHGNIGELETNVTILKLKILAPVNYVTTTATTINKTKTKWCTNCGKRLKFNHKYCSRCGTEQIHPFLEDL